MGAKRSPLLIFGVALLSIGIPYLSHHCPFLSKSTPVIRISSGEIQGRIGYSLRSGKKFWQFLSIPFAEAPLGKLRFEPPIPVEKWEGVKQVVRYPSYCLQYDAIVLQRVQGKEDCLYLNVFVSSPDKVQSDKSTRPVIVFIHGGGFLSSGSRTYHPDFFMDQDDLVVVTFNYRLGPFGFLNLAENSGNRSDLYLPRGNMGLKDQTLVLQWIQRNIASFGGDPGKVTLIGESAGAASVHLHTLSPRSQGLFHKAIALSGSAFNPWAVSREVKRVSLNLAKNLGCPLNDKEELVGCLQKADGGELVKLQKTLQEPTVENDLLVPSIEDLETEDTFLGEHPFDIVERDKAAKIPMILGVNSGEGGLIAARFDALPQITVKLEKIWRTKLASFASVDKLPSSIVEKIRCHYFGSNATFSSLSPSKFQISLAKLSSDTLFFLPAHRAALKHARSGAPTYLYHFNFKALLLPSTYSAFRAVTPTDWSFPEAKVFTTMVLDWIVEHTVGAHKGPRRFGISHAEDLYQTWNLEGLTGYFTMGDAYFSDALIETFVQFARNDHKNKSPLSFRGAPWPALSIADVTSDDKPLPCMLLDNSETPQMILEPYAESLEFWTSLGF